MPIALNGCDSNTTGAAIATIFPALPEPFDAQTRRNTTLSLLFWLVLSVLADGYFDSLGREQSVNPPARSSQALIV